jgi:hypothetical protein
MLQVMPSLRSSLLLLLKTSWFVSADVLQAAANFAVATNCNHISVLFVLLSKVTALHSYHQ